MIATSAALSVSGVPLTAQSVVRALLFTDEEGYISTPPTLS